VHDGRKPLLIHIPKAAGCETPRVTSCAPGGEPLGWATEIRVRAERRAGELLRKHGQERGRPISVDSRKGVREKERDSGERSFALLRRAV
jgi:hypothetical protein